MNFTARCLGPNVLNPRCHQVCFSRFFAHWAWFSLLQKPTPHCTDRALLPFLIAHLSHIYFASYSAPLGPVHRLVTIGAPAPRSHCACDAKKLLQTSPSVLLAQGSSCRSVLHVHHACGQPSFSRSRLPDHKSPAGTQTYL